MDVFVNDLAEERTTNFDEAIEQIMIEIETSSVDASCYLCESCAKTFLTQKGLKSHCEKKHSTYKQIDLENMLTEDELQQHWTEASNSAQSYTGDNVLLEENLSKNIVGLFNECTTTPSLVANFIKLLQDESINKPTRAVLVELLSILTHKKEQVHQQDKPKLNPISEIEKDVCYYIGGRVIRSLYYKTGDPIFQKFRKLSKNEERCWYLNHMAENIFCISEAIIKIVLEKHPQDFDSGLVAEEVIDKLKQRNMLHEIESSQLAMERVSEMVKKYARTRGHAYAKRITELFQKKKLLEKQLANKGKGKRTSFRNDLQCCSKS